MAVNANQDDQSNQSNESSSEEESAQEEDEDQDEEKEERAVNVSGAPPAAAGADQHAESSPSQILNAADV